MGELNSPTFESSEFETFEEEGEESPTALVEAVTRDEYETAWQVTLDVTDQPAAEQLAKLAEELRLKLRVDAQFEKALQKPVSFKVTDGSRLQAIEDICRQLELTPKYSPVAISLDSGGRKHPVTFVGPFLVAINEFKTVPQTATGQLSLKVFAAGLPPRLLASLNEGMQNPIDLETVTDQKQNNLQRQVTFNMGNMPSAAGVCHRDVIIDLKNLLRNVEKLSKLKGKISFKLPLQIELMKFNELEPGTKQTAAAATLELTDVGGGSVTFEYSGIGHDDVDLHAFDAGGKPLDSFGGGSFGSGDSGQISKSFQNAPDRIEARVVTQQEDLEYRFEFESVPVPNHDQMPKQLSELRFERDAPLAVKFDSITGEQNFRNVKLHVSNQSNKDAQSLSLSFRYLDKQGKELETKSKQHESGDIPAEQKREVEVMAFFMPDQTQTVEVALNSVEFSDASRWDAEE